MQKQRYLLLLLLFMFLLVNPVFSQVTVIKAGYIVDPATGKITASQDIIVEKGKIEALRARMSAQNSEKVIDLSDFYVLPGLIDAHSHLCSDVLLDESWQGQVTERFTSYVTQTSTAYRALVGAAKARSMLESGFTTVRDLGNAGNFADTDLRLAIESGLIPGPTIINSGIIIAPFGGQFHLHAERPELGTPEYFHADSRDEIQKAIRKNIHFGAKVIKIVVDSQPYQYSIEDIRFMVEEAGRAGLKVAAHAHSEEGARSAIEARVASIEHGTHMSDELLQLAKERNVALVGTEMPKWVLSLFGSESRYPLVIDRLKRAHKIGVNIIYGSDALFEVGDRTRGEMTLSNLESWMDAEIPPSVALHAMTGGAAELLGIENERGFLKKGQMADIIAVKKNPLEDIWALKEVVFVMKNGEVLINNLQ